MNPLLALVASVLRHIIVTGLFAIVALLNMPDGIASQVEKAADWTAPALISAVTWAALKYGPTLAKKIPALARLFPALILTCAVSFSLASCALPLNPATAASVAAGQDIPVTTIQRTETSAPVQVATADLIAAESSPVDVYGLLNLSQLAESVRAITSTK